MGDNGEFFQVVAKSISPVASAVVKFYFTNSKLTYINIFQFSKSRGFKALLPISDTHANEDYYVPIRQTMLIPQEVNSLATQIRAV